MPGDGYWVWILGIVTVGTLLVAGINLILNWRRDRRESELHCLARVSQIAEAGRGAVHSQEDPVTQLDLLTTGMRLYSRQERSLCKRLYEIGKRQFDHRVNNRNYILQDARQKMAEIRRSENMEDIREAELLGIQLARMDDENSDEIGRRLEMLPASTRMYAMYKKIEEETALSIARDLEKGIPVTDYTEVKERMAAGASLPKVFEDLPIPWQKIREIPWPERHRKTKPQSPIYIPTTIHHADLGLLHDKKAELDGEWLISHKYDIVYPYLGPTSVYKFIGDPPHLAKVGEKYVIASDYPPEWETKLWRRGGYLDEVFERATRGEDPFSLRRRRLRRQRTLAIWGFEIALFCGLLFVVTHTYL